MTIADPPSVPHLRLLSAVATEGGAAPAASRAEPADHVITIRGLRKTFSGTGGSETTVLGGIDLDVSRGEVFGILGRSGAGKSTLIRCINGLEQPTEGSVVVDGVDLAKLRGGELRAHRRRIGMVFQHFNLLASRTAIDNVALPLELSGASKADRHTRARELLDLVGLSEHAARFPAQLSGGQKQRVGIARALAGDPSVLLADEATSALDETTASSVQDLLQRLNRELGLTVVLVTHQLSVVKRLCHSAAVLDAGLVVDRGTLHGAIGNPSSHLGRQLLPALPDEGAGHARGARVVDAVLIDEDARAALQPTGDSGPLRAAAALPGIDLEVLSAVYEVIDGRPVARLRLALRGPAAHEQHTLAGLRAAGLVVTDPTALRKQEEPAS